jgi:hypothetical protein
MRLEAQQGRTHTLLSRGNFAIGLPISEAPTMPGSASYSPWRSMGWQGERDPTIQPPYRRLVGVQWRESGRTGGERKIRATAAGRRSGGKREGDVG